MKVTDKFRQMIRIIERMEKIESKRQRHKDALATLDAQLADLGVEWADVTKSLSDDVAMALPPSLVPNRALPEAKSPRAAHRPSMVIKQRKVKILKKLRDANKPLAMGEIIRGADFNRQQARLAILELIEENKITKSGKTKSVRYKAK